MSEVKKTRCASRGGRGEGQILGRGRRLGAAIASVAAGGALLLASAAVGVEEKKEGEDPRFAEMDKGPADIDVAGYPEENRGQYKLFKSRCGKCHTPARAVNSSLALPDEWERYIKRMMRKPGSGISPEDGKRIYEFLKYDSSVRKKDLIEKKLAEQQREQKQGPQEEEQAEERPARQPEREE